MNDFLTTTHTPFPDPGPPVGSRHPLLSEELTVWDLTLSGKQLLMCPWAGSNLPELSWLVYNKMGRGALRTL